jgi:hypothetical protein
MRDIASQLPEASIQVLPLISSITRSSSHVRTLLLISLQLSFPSIAHGYRRRSLEPPRLGRDPGEVGAVQNAGLARHPRPITQHPLGPIEEEKNTSGRTGVLLLLKI